MAITMDNNNRAFTGMWIPAAIWLHEDLNITEKCLIAEIVSLNNNAGGCFASNAHFSKFLNLSKNRVSAILSSLQDRGWITLINERRNNQIIKRQILVAFNYGPTGLPTPKDKDNDANSDEEPNEEGIPNTEGGIPNTEGGIPSTDKPLPYSEGGIPNSRKVNSHLNNQLNNHLNNHNNKQEAEEKIYKPEALRFYEENGFGTLSPVVVESIIDRMQDFEKLGASKQDSDDVIKEALKIAAFENNRKWNYVKGILKNWHNAGVFNLEMIKAAEKEREASVIQSKTPWKAFGKTESVPDWFNEENKGEEIDQEKDAEFAERRRKIRARKNQA